MSEMPKLPPTARRVAWNTSGKVNADIRGRTLKNMERAIDSGDLDGAIRRMDREWDTERVLETNAACLLLLSLGLGVAKDRRWRWLTGRGRVSPAARSPRLVPALARDSGLGCTHRRGDWRGADGPQVPAGGLYWRGPGHGIRPPRR